jgi:hypothetical protein
MRFRSMSRGLGIVRYVKLSGQLTIGYPLKATTLERRERPPKRAN